MVHVWMTFIWILWKVESCEVEGVFLSVFCNVFSNCHLSFDRKAMNAENLSWCHLTADCISGLCPHQRRSACPWDCSSCPPCYYVCFTWPNSLINCAFLFFLRKKVINFPVFDIQTKNILNPSHRPRGRTSTRWALQLWWVQRCFFVPVLKNQKPDSVPDARTGVSEPIHCRDHWVTALPNSPQPLKWPISQGFPFLEMSSIYFSSDSRAVWERWGWSFGAVLSDVSRVLGCDWSCWRIPPERPEVASERLFLSGPQGPVFFWTSFSSSVWWTGEGSHDLFLFSLKSDWWWWVIGDGEWLVMVSVFLWWKSVWWWWVCEWAFLRGVGGGRSWLLSSSCPLWDCCCVSSKQV